VNAAPRVNRAPEIRRALTDVRRVCDALGLTANGGKTVIRQPRGLTVRCVWHEENTPSCSVTLAEDGTIRVRCFGCNVGGDVLSLIAAARGMSLRSDFRAVLAEGARLAGLWGIVDELEGRGQAPPPISPPAPTSPAQPPREWPPVEQVRDVWDAAGLVGDDPEAAAYMRGRGLDPDRIDAGDLARVLGTRALPRWASYRGEADSAKPWPTLGYRVVVPMFSAAGELRSLRAWRIVDGPGPKRLPPAGHKASELVMADGFGRAMLAGTQAPSVVVVVEGEPDHCARSLVTNDPRTAVLGIVSGSWGPVFAARCPLGAKVAIRTDADKAGDKYAADIAESLARRCFTYRSV
jgi:hypothetical protein